MQVKLHCIEHFMFVNRSKIQRQKKAFIGPTAKNGFQIRILHRKIHRLSKKKYPFLDAGKTQ